LKSFLMIYLPSTTTSEGQRCKWKSFFAQSQQSGAVVAETLRTYKKELMDDLQNLGQQWEQLNRSLIALQEHVFAKHEDVQFELDHLEEDSEEYALLEDTLDDLSLVYAELTDLYNSLFRLSQREYRKHAELQAKNHQWFEQNFFRRYFNLPAGGSVQCCRQIFVHLLKLSSECLSPFF